MKPITLRIDGTDAAGLPLPPLPLGPGMHAFSRDATAATLRRVDDSQAASIQFCVDRRGVWLTVGDDTHGVHVNGRPVQRMAMLRIGDSVHADGATLVLAGPAVQAPAAERQPRRPAQASGDPRTVLRGVGGRHHGRSFTLDHPRIVGSEAACDIRIDDPAFPARHCRIGMEGEALVLRALDPDEGSIVNGVAVRNAVLHGGDQVVFDAHQRFVVEAPASERLDDEALPLPDDAPPIAPADARRRALGRSARRLPWVLLAALLIAGLLSALLLSGGAG